MTGLFDEPARNERRPQEVCTIVVEAVPQHDVRQVSLEFLINPAEEGGIGGRYV